MVIVAVWKFTDVKQIWAWKPATWAERIQMTVLAFLLAIRKTSVNLVSWDVRENIIMIFWKSFVGVSVIQLDHLVFSFSFYFLTSYVN